MFGGGERYPVELARAIARRVDCKLVTFGSRPARFHDEELEVDVLERRRLRRGHPAHPVGRGLWRALDNADIVHVHHLRAYPSRVALGAATVRRQRRVVTDHGLGAGPWPRADALMFDRFLTVSRYSARTLAAPRAKTTVIFGGADTKRFSPEGDSPRSGVLFVGRLTPHKGIDRLIEALPGKASLTIAGTPGHDPDPPERDYPLHLHRLAASRNVRFVGTVEEAALPLLYRRARVLVLPSVHETCYGKHVAIPELLGLSLLEAMASGTPVIASKVGGVPEVVLDGMTGFLVEPGDVAGLRDRIELLLRDERLFKKMSAAARAHVEENFTWDRCAERCVDAYSEVMGAA